MAGRAPSGQATRASPEPASSLGHTASVLRALAERCEQMVAPDRELDYAIADAVLGPVKAPYVRGRCEHYTASLDAAMMLVPDEYDWAVFRTNGGLTVHAWCGNREDVFGATPALALCAAALRARAAMGDA